MCKKEELDFLIKLLKIPSVSAQNQHKADCARAADFIAERFRAVGLTCHVEKTPGNPIVVAKSKKKTDKATMLVYGHYDVQPPEPLELWQSSPFEPEIRDGKIYARGASDNKGQFAAHILGCESFLREHGDLPLNLIFVIEGEEEIGSSSLAPFLRAKKQELACDIVAVSDTGMIAEDLPTMTYGLRGIIALSLKIRGAKSDLHSGIFGGAAPNPLWALGKIVSSLRDTDGRIVVDGVYDDVDPPQVWERELWQTLNYDEILTRIMGTETTGEKGFSATESVWVRPSLDINGLGGGYQGEGFKTVIPSEAMAKISLRLVPSMQADKIEELLERKIRELSPVGYELEFEFEHNAKPYLFDPRSSFGEAAQRALRRAFSKNENESIALIREGGSIPIVQDFKEILNSDTLLLGLALPDANIHAPNESFPLANFRAGVVLHQFLIEEIAKSF